MTRTFGVEIECIGTQSRDTIAQKITEAGIPCYSEGYNHLTRNHWKIVTDASVGYGRGMEIVSPILSGENGFDQIRKVCDVLTAEGCTVNVSCGLHVHIGAADFTLQQIKTFSKWYIKFEDFFDLIMPKSRRGISNRYVGSNRAIHGAYTSEDSVNRAFQAIDGARTMLDLQYAVCRNNRFHKLNLMAFNVHGTVEFRQHSGTTEAAKVINWVKLLLAMVEEGKDGRPRPRKRSDISTSVAFNRFFKRFKCKDLRAFYVARWNDLNSGEQRRKRAA